MRRIKRFGILQTAKVAAVIYFLIAAVFTIPFWLLNSMLRLNELFPEIPFTGGIFFIIIPFFYAFIAFIFTAISCAIYNVIASFIGGIEVEVEEVGIGTTSFE